MSYRLQWGLPTRLALGVVTVLVLGAALVAASGANPVSAAVGLFLGAFGERYMIGETILSATPLAIIALGVIPALRAGVFTVGSEGQLIFGAIAATATVLALPGQPPVVLLPAGAIAGMLGGMAWAILPALLRAYARVNEILSTLLLNYIATSVLVLLVRTVMRSGMRDAVPHSPDLPDAALLPKVLSGTRLHVGVLLVFVAVSLLAWWLKSFRGFTFDVFARRPDLAARMGLSEPRAVIVTMLVAGAAAGLVGWMQVAGVTGTLYTSVSGGLGFTGIVVALLGGLRPAGTLLAALFFGALATGADGLQAGSGVPASISTVIEGLLLLVAALTFVGGARARTEKPPESPSKEALPSQSGALP